MKQYTIQVKVLYFLGVLFFCSPSLLAQSSKISEKQYLVNLEQNIPIWLEEKIVPGAAITIIYEEEVLIQKGFGSADRKNNVVVDVETGFNIASISKTITAWGVMKLVEDGIIELDSPAVKYLTRWNFPDSKFDINGVTIRRLLSHTAGLSLQGYKGWTLHDTSPTLEESLSGKTNGSGDVKLIMEPGKNWNYSGGGYTLLQLIIEEVTGREFADYMQVEILQPLGMKNSSFNINPKIIKESSLAHDSDGEIIPFEVFTAQAASGFQTTLEDLTTFALAHFDILKERKDNSIINSKTLKLMTTAQLATGGRYGLGYTIDSISGGTAAFVGHTGANTGWNSTFQLRPETGDGFIVLTNGDAGLWLYRQVFCDYINWRLNTSVDAVCKKALEPLLRKTLKEKGIEETIAKYLEIKFNNAAEYIFHPMILDKIGADLLKKNKTKDAIELFAINAKEYPKVWKVFESLGEAYLKNGQSELAMANYYKALELNSNNKNLEAIVAKLSNK